MNVTGIIAEYNPFHSGHAYHIEEARTRTGADFVVVAMSGDFAREAALPSLISIPGHIWRSLAEQTWCWNFPPPLPAALAEEFAACGVALLDRIGVTDCLCFGSEHGDTSAH